MIYIDALEFIADHSDEKYIVLQELYNISSDYPNVFILTSASWSNPQSYAEKIEWINKYIPKAKKRVIFSNDKTFYIFTNPSPGPGIKFQ